MPANVLQRELDAYADALEKYQRGAQNYNAKVSTFNQSFLTDASGNKYVYQKPYQDVAIITDYVFDPFFNAMMPVVSYQPFTAGDKFYVADAKGKLTETTKPKGNYGFTNLEGNYQALRINPNEKGAYPTKPPEWTKTFDKKAPEATTAQMRRLDEPSLSDIERNQSSGLIGSAFNF
jgi:hypothetical protein